MNTITVIGLGTSDTDKMPLGVYKQLAAAKKIFVRTMDHPAAVMLEDEGMDITSFDSYYEESDDFSNTYERITRTLLKEAEHVTCCTQCLGIRWFMKQRLNVFWMLKKKGK